MGGQGKRLVARSIAFVQNPNVRLEFGQAGGQLTCQATSAPGATWLDKRSHWLAAVSKLPKEHLSPLPLTLSLRGPHKNFSDYFA